MTKVPHAFGVSDRIHHSVYGQGTITVVDEKHTVINFDQNGRKKFVTEIVQLEHSDEPAPKPRARRTRAKTPGKPS